MFKKQVYNKSFYDDQSIPKKKKNWPVKNFF